MVDLHLLGHSDKVYQHEVMVSWNKNTENRAEVETTLNSRATLANNATLR